MAKLAINLPLMIILLIIFLLVIGTEVIWAVFLVGILIVAELFGIISGLFNAELREMDAANPQAPEGKEFIAKGLSRTGKAIGKGEQAKYYGKHIREDRDAFGMLGQAAEDFMEGLGKLFKK